jgi:hypothetical protein
MAEVVDFRAVRAQRRLSVWRQKVARVMDANRRTLGRLYSTGALFSPQGSKVGRDLLLAHQCLIKITDLLDRLSNEGEVPPPRSVEGLEKLYSELDALLDRTQVLTLRSGDFLARLRRE